MLNYYSVNTILFLVEANKDVACKSSFIVSWIFCLEFFIINISLQEYLFENKNNNSNNHKYVML